MEFQVSVKICHVIPRKIVFSAVEPAQLFQAKFKVFFNILMLGISSQTVFERSCGKLANELQAQPVLCPHVLPCWKICIEIVRLLIKDPQRIGIEILFHPGELLRAMPFELRYLPFAIPEHIL